MGSVELSPPLAPHPPPSQPLTSATETRRRLDQVNLQVLSTSGAVNERADAEKVLKLLEKGRHWVLVCLLLRSVEPDATSVVVPSKMRLTSASFQQCHRQRVLA